MELDMEDLIGKHRLDRMTPGERQVCEAVLEWIAFGNRSRQFASGLFQKVEITDKNWLRITTPTGDAMCSNAGWCTEEPGAIYPIHALQEVGSILHHVACRNLGIRPLTKLKSYGDWDYRKFYGVKEESTNVNG